MTKMFNKFECFYTGSSVVCDPPVLNTDKDIVVIYSDELNHMLCSQGFRDSKADHGIQYQNSSVSCCYRKDDINIIAVSSQWHYDNWLMATKLATHMNLTEKKQRVALFQFMTEGAVRDTDIVQGIRFRDDSR